MGSLISAAFVIFASIFLALFLIGAYQIIRDLKRKEKQITQKAHPDLLSTKPHAREVVGP